MRDVKSSENRTGWSRWWEGLSDIHVYSCEGFFLRLLRDLQLNVPHTPTPHQQSSLEILRPYVLGGSESLYFCVSDMRRAIVKTIKQHK